MIDRLRLRVGLNQGEPAHSIIARLAVRHAVPIDGFVRSIGMTIPAAASGLGLERLGKLAGLDPAAIARSTARKTGTGQAVQLGGETLSWKDWSAEPRRYCPGCLTDDLGAPGAKGSAAWHRAWWDVRAILVCPFHRRPLESRCPACSKSLDWTGLSLGQCPSGHDLSDPATGDLGAALDSYILGRICSEYPRRKNAFLDQYSIGQCARIAERLGAVCRDGWSCSYQRRNLWQLRTIGFAATQSIETTLGKALARVLAEAPTGSAGLIASYGWVYRSWLGVPGADQSGGRLRALLREHAAQRGVISAAEVGGRPHGVPLKLAARAMGKSRARARSIIGAAGILPHGTRRGVGFLIDEAELQQLTCRLGRLVDRQTAAGMLGIGRAQLRSLINADLLTCDREALRLGHDRQIDVGALAALRARLASDLRAPRASANARPMPAACRDAGVPIWKACRAILDGHLRPAGQSDRTPGLDGIWIDPADLRPFAVARARPVMSVAAALAIHPEAASNLMKAGAFAAQAGCVSPASIAAFAAANAKPDELARLTGSSRRSVMSRLAQAGVAPAFGPPQCRQIFYPRAQAMARLKAGGSPQRGV